MPLIRVYDTEDQFSWSQKVYIYYGGFDGELGPLWQTLVRYDNGVGKLDIMRDGIVTSSSITDIESDGGIYNWSERVSTYDVNGQLETIGTIFDTGITQMDRYEDGNRVSSMRQDSEANTESWSHYDLMYDADGELATKIISYDNGIAKVTQYAAGQITTKQTYDTGNVQAWDTIGESFDQYGQRSRISTTYDDGTVNFAIFEDGVRRQVEELDPENMRNWDSRSSSYDQYGQLTLKVTETDNGILRLDHFEDGQRTRIEQYDNPEADGDGINPWERIEITYDNNGQVSEKATFYDNGVLKVKYYDKGILRQFDQIDQADVKVWESIEVDYHAFGEKRIYTTYDDGVERFEFRHGTESSQQGRFIIDEDLSGDGNARNWQINGRSYDENNVLMGQKILYDNGDKFVFLHTDGELEHKMEQDGNNTNTWAFRVTDYTNQGPVVTTYDTAADAPDDVLDYFDGF